MSKGAPPAVSDFQGYWAFISYSSRDRQWGEWLHRRLERYPIPNEIQGTEIFDGAILGKNLRPIFRDRDELSGSAHLGPAIHAALEKSRFLIVLCSPNSARSDWVNKEIVDFKALCPENSGRILALILSGEPNAIANPTVDDSLECFPPALRYPAEPLAGDLRAEGDGKERGFLKVLSGIIQLDFDALYRRHERYLHHRRMVLGSIAGTLILVLSGLTAFALLQRNEARRQTDLAIQRRVETQRTMATGFLRSIGQSRDTTLSGAEEVALLELAAVTANDRRVREEFIGRLLEEPESCRRLLARGEMAVHAAVGFNRPLRDHLSNKARETLADKAPVAVQREAALMTLAYLADGPGDSAIVRAELSAWITQPSSSTPLMLAAEITEAIGGTLDADEANQLAEQLAGRLGKIGGTGDENQLCRMLVAIAPRLGPERADQAVEVLVGRMLPSVSAGQLDYFGAAVEALAPRASPERRARSADMLVTLMVTEPLVNRVNAAGAAFNAIAPAIPPPEARAYGERLRAAAGAGDRTPLHGLLAAVACSALGGLDAGLEEKLAITVLDRWGAAPAALETQACLAGLRRVFGKLDPESGRRVVDHLLAQLSGAASPLRNSRRLMIGEVVERFGHAAMVPRADLLLDFYLQSENYDEMVFLLGVLTKCLPELEATGRESIVAKLKEVLPATKDVTKRMGIELLIENGSPVPGEDVKIRFQKSIPEIVEIRWPGRPTGLRLVDDGTPRGLQGWDKLLDRSRGPASPPRNPNMMSAPGRFSGLDRLADLVPEVDTADIVSARGKLLAACLAKADLREASLVAGALLIVAPALPEDEAETVAGRLLELGASEAGSSYVLHSIPALSGLVPRVRAATAERILAHLLRQVRQGYPASVEQELRLAVIAAANRVGRKETVIVELLPSFLGRDTEVLAPWFSPLLEDLPPEILLNLLKAPFCLGAARDLCAAALATRLGIAPPDAGKGVALDEVLSAAASAGNDPESPWRSTVR